MSWPAQSADVNPIELVLDKLYRKVRAKQLSSATHIWEDLSLVYLLSLREKMLRICEAVIVPKRVHFDESKVKEFFCGLLIQFVFNVAQEVLCSG